ncbi:MAG: ATPase, T2SS/T4P/T4SS family [Acetobacter syzygii]|uniref:type IV pilus twitching motility protein PilT n=1 Tax=Acetobacteraceae TaxID=433 RepID=UPI0039ED25D0
MNDIIDRLKSLPPSTNLDTILTSCVEMGASRIHLQTDTSLKVRVHGRNYTVPSMRWNGREVEDALATMYKSATGASRLSQAAAIDTSYIIWPDRRKRRYGFRVNAVATTIGSNDGIGIVLRPLPEKPTPLEEQYVEPRLAEALEGETGGYLICGVTGSGKTTLMGGITRQRLEDPNCHCDIVQGAAPLELFYDLIEQKNASIQQVEIPRQLDTFPDFIRAAMREEPTDIEVGECRDAETMEATIQAIISGHRTTTSVHTNDPPATIRRVVSLCPASDRDSLAIALVDNLKLIVNQRLLRSTDGERTAIRSFLPFNRKIRETLLDAPQARWPNMVRDFVEQHGQTFEQSIKDVHAQGRISDEIAACAMKELH